MPFQSTVRVDQGFGIPGEMRLDTPHRADSYILDTTAPANNVVGRFCTVKSEGVAEVGGTGALAGFLANPKVYALKGIAGDTLAPTLLLDNNEQVEILCEGDIIVEVQTAADISDVVYYDTTTGEISTAAPGAAAPAGTAPAYAQVKRYQAAQDAQPGLALIHVDLYPLIA